MPAFSLIEIMVAILIIGTVFTGLISAFPLALKISKNAENRTRAAYYAQEKIEELYQLNYSAIPAGTIEARQAVGAEHPRRAYERETTVVYLDEDFNESADDAGLKKIICRIHR